MEELRNKHKTWIKEFLVLNLIENQKLMTCENPKEHIVIQSIEIKELSLDIAFMLTNCYFVKISANTAKEHVKCGNNDINDGNVFDIVVKVKLKHFKNS